MPHFTKPAYKHDLFLAPGGIDAHLKWVLDDKAKKIADTKQAIADEERLTQQLMLDIEEAERNRDKILAEKQAVVDDLLKKVSVERSNSTDEFCISAFLYGTPDARILDVLPSPSHFNEKLTARFLRC